MIAFLRASRYPPPYLIAGLLLTGGVQAGSAQEPGVDQDTAPGRTCFQGRPLPDCSSFFIFELRGDVPFVQTTRVIERGSPSSDPFEFAERTYGSSFGWELGHVWNLNSRYAAGATLGLEVGDPGLRYFVRARGRRWLNKEQRLSLVLAPGLFVSGDGPSFINGGFTVDARVNVQDKLALIARYDVLNRDPILHEFRRDPGGLQHALSLGVDLGSTPALWGTGAVATGYLILIALFIAAYAE